MANFNFIIREDNVGKIISEDGMLDAVDIEETLQSKYNYLYNSMKEDNYTLKINHCTYFKEIVFKKKVVGFFAYTIINSLSNLSLVASFILPEFRGRGLFFDEINDVFENGKQISIYYPPRFIIELLIKYGFATKINENIALTSIKMDIPSNMISDIYGGDELIYNDYVYTSIIYDFKSCGFIITPEENKNIIYLTRPYEEDMKNNETKKTRKNINNNYFEEIKNVLNDNKSNIEKFLKTIEKNYPIPSYNILDDNNEIDFEKLKDITKKEEINENILENFEKIGIGKNSLHDTLDNVNKENYIKSYQDVAIYEFIRLFIDNNNIELTNSIIKIDYEFKNDYIKNLVIKEGLISNEVDVKEVKKYLKSLTVNELKDILKNNNLTVTGNKSKLIHRIIKYVPDSNIMDNDYTVTDKGLKFIEEHEDITIYNKFLKNFYYHEFKEFILKNTGSVNEVAILFLKKHLAKSIENKDFKALSDSLNALAHINKNNNNYEESLHYELKKFIIGLNPIFLDEKYYNYYQPINKNNIENIKFLLSKEKFNLEDEFEKAWTDMEIKEFLIPYNKSFKYLNRMISGADRDIMNDKIREKYLSKENIIHDKLDKSVQTSLDKFL
ncbi:MAG: hypothetical protein BZ135_00070 [Methanosphaera sp. rholeuAM6]|nr:MAG: hypothetical protein BZ135_00070 [Methanosphaera sp. rholeuAM6]